jgi:hypothetical protein
MHTTDEQWADMCDKFRKMREAYTSCLRGLFRDGRIVSQERLAECERLRVTGRQFREEMKVFLNDHLRD